MQKGDRVQWKWGSGTAEGTIQERYTESVTRTLQGNDVTRNGSHDDAALLIEQEDGDRVLKLESEVKKA